MRLVELLFAVSLLSLCQTQGASRGTPVFVQTGKDLSLDVKERFTLGEEDDFKWRFNDTINIGKLSFDNRISLFHEYKQRAELFVQNHTLRLKNVQKNDSGLYTAHVSGGNEQLVAGYKVTVQDEVSSVKVTVNSSNPCNLTVTCSTEDSHITGTLTCDKNNCSLEEGNRPEATTYPSSISVYLEQDFIICNHSNQVSWQQDRKLIKFACDPSPVENGANKIAIWAGTGIASAVLVILICAGILICCKKKKNGNTIYEVPGNNTQTQTPNQYYQEDPTSTYCLVDFHTGPSQSTIPQMKPETVYAQVNRAAKNKCRSPTSQRPELEHTDN